MRRTGVSLACAAALSALCALSVLSVLSALSPRAAHADDAQHVTWRDYGGGPDQSRFVRSAQITKDNVAELRVEWTYAPGDERAYVFSPIVVDDVMYVLGAGSSLVALNARTGEELWKHDGLTGIASRGVNFWQSGDGTERRILIVRNNELQALDAATGGRIVDFGDGGAVDLRVGLGRDPESVRRVQSQTPGRVFENLIVLGSSPGEGLFSPPGHIRAYDVVTGELAWTFHTIPQPGEFGYETWPKDAYLYAGGVNAWGEMSVDAERGIIYIPLGSPTYDYYGADRIGANLFGNCLVALDARTGKRLWHFQTVHHDLWDYDLTAAPQLLTVTHEGERVDVVAQATKHGFLFVFDRVTGEPLWPIEERAVPPSSVPGEQAWPTQPFPTVLPITARQIMTPDDVGELFVTAEEREAWQARVAAAGRGLFLPPALTETVAVPGAVGGTNWGNTAANPDAGILYVLNQDFPSFYQLEPVEPEPTDATAAPVGPPAAGGRGGGAGFANAGLVRTGTDAFTRHCEVCHGDGGAGGASGPALQNVSISYEELARIVTNGQGRMPPLVHVTDDEVRGLAALLSRGAAASTARRTAYPEGVAAPEHEFRTAYGLSHPYIMSPPWSTIQAIDLNDGRLLWRKPLGQDEEAAAAGREGTGVPRGAQRNGMIVTDTGLVFSTAKDGHVYAFDAATGDVLWKGELPMGTEGLPATYTLDGRQYLVVNATTPLTWGRRSREGGIGSEEPSGVGGYVVFALPPKRE